MQSKNHAFSEATKHFFVNDREHAYLTDEGKPFRWIRGYQLGGRSLSDAGARVAVRASSTSRCT